MSDVFDLDEVDDYTFSVKVNNEVKHYDPFALIKAVRNLAVNPGDEQFEDSMDGAREAFGFPRADSGQPTVSTVKMLALLGKLTDFLNNEVPELGKLLGGTPSLPDSSSKTSD